MLSILSHITIGDLVGFCACFGLQIGTEGRAQLRAEPAVRVAVGVQDHMDLRAPGKDVENMGGIWVLYILIWEIYVIYVEKMLFIYLHKLLYFLARLPRQLNLTMELAARLVNSALGISSLVTASLAASLSFFFFWATCASLEGTFPPKCR